MLKDRRSFLDLFNNPTMCNSSDNPQAALITFSKFLCFSVPITRTLFILFSNLKLDGIENKNIRKN